MTLLIYNKLINFKLPMHTTTPGKGKGKLIKIDE
jgi:hypothetical protein